VTDSIELARAKVIKSVCDGLLKAYELTDIHARLKAIEKRLEAKA
jgi:hypothetical protein